LALKTTDLGLEDQWPWPCTCCPRNSNPSLLRNKAHIIPLLFLTC